MKIIKIILDSVSYVFYFLLILVAFFTITSNSSLLGNYQSFLIRSGSMEPTIMTGDVILIKTMKTYGEKDVITFKEQNDRIVTHRILKEIEKSGEITFITKGDANRSIDNDDVVPTQILGKVVFIVPKLGFLATFVHTPLGLMLTIIIPALLIIIDRILKITSSTSTTNRLYR